MGMANEKFPNGVMNVPTVNPATPMLAAPNPKLSSGSVADVKTNVKRRDSRTNATYLLSSGSAADVVEKRPKSRVELMKPGSAVELVASDMPASGSTVVDGGAARVRVMAIDAGGDGAVAVTETGRVKSRLLSRTLVSASATSTTAGSGLVFAAPNPGRELAPSRCRVPACPVEEVGVDVDVPGGFSGRR